MEVEVTNMSYSAEASGSNRMLDFLARVSGGRWGARLAPEAITPPTPTLEPVSPLSEEQRRQLLDTVGQFAIEKIADLGTPTFDGRTLKTYSYTQADNSVTGFIERECFRNSDILGRIRMGRSSFEHNDAPYGEDRHDEEVSIKFDDKGKHVISVTHYDNGSFVLDSTKEPFSPENAEKMKTRIAAIVQEWHTLPQDKWY
jgi:hypothetical protein